MRAVEIVRLKASGPYLDQVSIKIEAPILKNNEQRTIERRDEKIHKTRPSLKLLGSVILVKSLVRHNN